MVRGHPNLGMTLHHCHVVKKISEEKRCTVCDVACYIGDAISRRSMQTET